MSMSTKPGVIRQAWWRWKSLRLPWRKRWLVGYDLIGNTFWEFKDAINAGRLRRIVQYTRKVHHSDVNLPPQWVQWLRHAREKPPTINEQQLDEIRQAQMKELAKRADARWAAKPSALDKQADTHALPSAHPPAEATPKDFAHQAQVMETVGENAPELAREVPMERQDQILPDQRGQPQDTLTTKVETKAVSEAKPAVKPAAAAKPDSSKGLSKTRAREFKGFKLGGEGQQQPVSWAPKPARRG